MTWKGPRVRGERTMPPPWTSSSCLSSEAAAFSFCGDHTKAAFLWIPGHDVRRSLL